ncbi:MAG TPA: redoxin domain-containing protein [Dissulfurispiraceae bacterium]
MKDFADGKSVRAMQAILTVVGAVLAFFTYTASAQALLQIGSQAPEFSLGDLEGKEVSLSRDAGSKGTAILFWSTWSAHSQKALKRLEEFHRKYKEKGVKVIAVNADKQIISFEDMQKVKKIVKDLDITFPVLFDKGLKTFHDYSIIALPSTIVVSEGKLVYELPGLPLVGTEDLFDYLLTLAGEQPGKKVEPGYMPRHDAIAEASLARSFIKKKRYELAYAPFLKAIEKDPKYMLPYIELAKLYAMEGKNAEAEEVLKKALASEPGNVVASSELGYLQVKEGKLKEGTELLDKAAKANSYPPSHYYHAYALGLNGQLKESLEAFAQAVSSNPYEPFIYILRAEVYGKNNMMKESAADYRKALELVLKVRG